MQRKIIADERQKFEQSSVKRVSIDFKFENYKNYNCYGFLRRKLLSIFTEPNKFYPRQTLQNALLAIFDRSKISNRQRCLKTTKNLLITNVNPMYIPRS